MEDNRENKSAYNLIPVEATEKNHKLLKLIQQPWKLIREGGKLGVKGVKRFVINLFLFSATNLFLLFYAVYRWVFTHFAVSKVLIVLLVLILGIGFTFYAASRTYRYVMVDTIRVIYGSLASFFQKISDWTIEKSSPLLKGKVPVSNEQLTKALDFGKMVNSKFRKTPRFLRKAVILILNRLPVVGMVTDLRGEILKGNKAEASKKLYAKMDGYIQDSVFETNNTRWVWWLLPANVLIQLLLIWWGIG